MESKLVTIQFLANITGLSTNTVRMYIDHFTFSEYRRRKNEFYFCQDSLNRLYTYILNKGNAHCRAWEAAITLKNNYPNAKKIKIKAKK